MQKMQILFPEPQLDHLRRLAKAQDRPVSEIVRAAVDAWLAKHGEDVAIVSEPPPTYHCGPILIDDSDLRSTAYSDRSGE